MLFARLSNLAARLRRIGPANAWRLALYHSWHVLRYSTPRKAVNALAVRLQRRWRVERVRGMPYRYFFDPTNFCNLQCALCPSGLGTIGRARGRMDWALYTRLVDEVAPYAYSIELYNWGEPLLHPRLGEMIAYAHARRISVRMSSNLNLLTPATAELLVRSRLDRLIVSVDGSTQEVYERYRRGGDLARVQRNLAMLVEARRRAGRRTPFILVRLLVNRHNEGQIEAVRALARQAGADSFTTGPLFVDTTDPAQVAEWLPADASLSYYDYAALENRWACDDLWEAMTVNWDGGVSPCCWVHRQEHDLASAANQSLRAIWNGPAYRSARRALSGRGPGEAHTICGRCLGRPLYLKD